MWWMFFGFVSIEIMINYQSSMSSHSRSDINWVWWSCHNKYEYSMFRFYRSHYGASRTLNKYGGQH
jgi:hypothetical protein